MPRRLPALSPRWRRALMAAVVLGCVLIIAWDGAPLSHRQSLDPGTMKPREGHAYTANLAFTAANWFFGPEPDAVGGAEASTLELTENGKELGPAHALHKIIAASGRGGFSHWGTRVIFSSSDGSDPRTNGRHYEAHYAVAPAAWLVAVAWIALIATIATVIGAPLVARLRATRAGAYGVSILVVGALFALAVLATLTIWVPIPGTFSVVVKGSQPPEQTGDFDTGSRPGLVRLIPFERLVAPFLIVPSPQEGRPSPAVRIGLDKSPLREVIGDREWREASDAVFLDGDRIGGDALIVYLPPGASRGPATLRVTHLARVTPGGVGALWSIFAIAAITALVGRAFATARAPKLAATALALSALALAVLNLVGMTVPPRDFDTQFSVPSPPSGNFRPDSLAPYGALERRVAPRPGEPRADYARRMNDLVYRYVSHAWNYAYASQLELHIPPWENYLLWALGEVDARFYRYHYAAWRPALERGAGMCSQVALALVAILREQDFDARIVQLAGHTVVTAEVAPGKWHILDPDNGVAIPASLQAIESNPEIVREPYERTLEQLGHTSPRFYASVMVRFYGKDGNYVEPRGGNELLGEAWSIREKAAGWLKWGLPALLLLLAGAIAAATWARARRSHPN